MLDRSSALDAAVRAVRGESDLAAVWGARDAVRLARALCGGLPSLLDATTIADPALSDVMGRLIGTPAGQDALRAWAEVAPAGRGRPHAAALIAAVQRRRCDPGVAAALIGPGDESAALLSDPGDAAFAIRRWGQSDTADPTAWMGALSAGERRRLLDTMRGDSLVIASCLPWLPPDAAYRTRLDDVDVGEARTAFATASPVSHSLHATRLRRLVARANPTHLAEIMRLARVMDADGVWRRVETRIRAAPEESWRIVASAPWDALPEAVHAAILERVDESEVCTAVAAAPGKRTRAPMSWTTAIALFGALDPAVWDALDTDKQQRWRNALLQEDGHLAVRSPGLRPDILARAPLDDDLVRAAQRHARDATTLRAALLPVALRNLPMDDSHAVIASLPTMPPDAGAFFCIAGHRGDPSIIDRARTALRTPADLACAVVMQRITEDDESIRVRCAALRRALHGRTGDDLPPILALLTDDARAALMPDRDALVARLAESAHRDALRRALDGLDSLPLAASVPALSVLTRWTASNAADAADALADALQAHSDAFLAVADALERNDQIGAALPLPDDPARACTLRSLAQDDPVMAYRLAHALQTHDRRTALLALLHTSPAHAAAVWHARDDDVRQEIGAVVVVAPPDAAPPAERDPLAALALAAAHSDDADLRTAGVTALAARPDVLRARWTALPPEVRQMFRAHPAVADLLHAPHASAVGRRRL